MKDKTWEEEFDNEFHLFCRGEQSIVYASRREIKSFISDLLASQRKKIVLKGERNRVIAQIKDEVKKEIIERLPREKSLSTYEIESMGTSVEMPDELRGYNQAIQEVRDLLKEKR